MTINLTLNEKEFKKLEKISKTSGKTIDKVVSELIDNATQNTRKKRVHNDPMYKMGMEAYDVDVPSDFSKNHDHYLYNS